MSPSQDNHSASPSASPAGSSNVPPAAPVCPKSPVHPPLILVTIPADLRDKVTSDPSTFDSFIASVRHGLLARLLPVVKQDKSILVPENLTFDIFEPSDHLIVSFPAYDYSTFTSLFSKAFPDEKRFLTSLRGAEKIHVPIDFAIPMRYEEKEGPIFTYTVDTKWDPLPAIEEHFGDCIEVIRSATIPSKISAAPFFLAMCAFPKEEVEGVTPEMLAKWPILDFPFDKPAKFVSVRLVKDTPEARELFEPRFRSLRLIFTLVELTGVPSCKYCRAPHRSKSRRKSAPRCLYCRSRAHVFKEPPNRLAKSRKNRRHMSTQDEGDQA